VDATTGAVPSVFVTRYVSTNDDIDNVKLSSGDAAAGAVPSVFVTRYVLTNDDIDNKAFFTGRFNRRTVDAQQALYQVFI
jgi:hypothetical protein